MYKIDEIELIPFDKQDAMNPEYQAWFNDPEICRYNSHCRFPKLQKDFENFANSLDEKNQIVMKIIFETIWIGNVSLQDIDWINRNCEIAIIIDKNYWGAGIATKAVKQMCYHAFCKLNLHRISAGTHSENKGMIRVFEKIGFTQEGIRKESGFYQGKYWDILEFGMLKNTFERIYNESDI